MTAKERKGDTKWPRRRFAPSPARRSPTIRARKRPVRGGRSLLQDQHLLEKLARFNRERIPERVVHAVGSGAHGTFEVTSADVPRWTRMRMMIARWASGPKCSRASRPSPGRREHRTRYAIRAASRSSSTRRTATGISPATTRPSSSCAIRSSSPTSSTPEVRPVHEPAGAGQRLGLLLRSPGDDAPVHVAVRRSRHPRVRTGTWTASGRTRSSGSTPPGERFWVKFHFKTDQGIRA